MFSTGDNTSWIMLDKTEVFRSSGNSYNVVAGLNSSNDPTNADTRIYNRSDGP